MPSQLAVASLSAVTAGPAVWAWQVVDEGRQRAVVIHKKGFPDAVVWNPWIDKAAGMADFGDDEYKVGNCASYPAAPGAVCHHVRNAASISMLACKWGIPCYAKQLHLLHNQGMLCLEPAVAGSGPVTLEPGKTWTAQQRLSLRQL